MYLGLLVTKPNLITLGHCYNICKHRSNLKINNSLMKLGVCRARCTEIRFQSIFLECLWSTAGEGATEQSLSPATNAT